MLGMLAADRLEMTFPEGTIHGPDEFRAWYRGVRRQYFDQVHTLQRCGIRLDGPRAQVSILVRWEASTWRAPEAYSKRIVADAGQTWTVVRSPETGRAIIERYRVDTFTPVEAARQ
jgi:hypothetical protein